MAKKKVKKRSWKKVDIVLPLKCVSSERFLVSEFDSQLVFFLPRFLCVQEILNRIDEFLQRDIKSDCDSSDSETDSVFSEYNRRLQEELYYTSGSD